MREARELLPGIIAQEVVGRRHHAVEVQVVEPRPELLDLARDLDLVHVRLPFATRTMELVVSVEVRHDGPSSFAAAPSIWTASRYPWSVPTSTYERPTLTA